MGLKYVVERSIDDITKKLLTPAPLDEDPKPKSDAEDENAERT